ncbi:MAG: ribosomal-processing cysteine protease Prp [Bacilli bacterium]
MIKVENKCDYIKIYGHADFDTFGKDIVCASVSSIIYTTVNGLLNINQKSIKFSDNDEYMKIEILSNDDITLKLITNMIEMLKELSRKYPKNIEVINEK